MSLLLQLGIITVAAAVVWLGSALLESAAVRLGAHYRLPEIVQGAVIAAVGSSFPELSSAVIATAVHGEFELGVATIVGSAIFNILVIPALAGLVGGRLAASRLLVYKDAQFYILSVAVLLLVFSFALIYHPVDGTEWLGEVDRTLAAVPLLLYGLYLFLQQQDTAEEAWNGASTPDPEADDIAPLREWARLGLGLALILGAVEALVRSAITLGEILQTPSFLWGVTVIAVATSLPDAFVSVRAAQKDQSVVSLANVLGSNIFDLLVAIPAGVLVAGTVEVDFAVAAPMMGVLTFATIVLFGLMRTKLELSRGECVVLLALYAGFLLWMTLETLGVTSLVFG